MRRHALGDVLFAGRSGLGVIVAVVDSGVASGHPHVGLVSRGISLVGDGDAPGGYLDRIGHGTAVAAAIREKAPDVELVAVRVFDKELATSAQTLARGITWAAEQGARVVNLSLGTPNPARAALLQDAVTRAASLGAIVVSARVGDGTSWLPGSLPGVVGVELDWNCPRNEMIADDADGVPVFRASGYPRPIPGVPPARNLSGISFAVANVTGFIARLCEGDDACRTAADVMSRLGVEL